MPTFRVHILLLLLCLSASTSSAHKQLNKTGTAGPSPNNMACKPFYPIIAFGDSTTDTGNQLREPVSPAAHPPYGSSFFKRPTGRYSDGRLMIDFLTTALKEPFLPPHIARRPHFASENFAVGGATALSAKALHKLANVTSLTPESLDRQLLGFVYDTAHTNLSDALVYFGEIGGNDFNYALAARRPPRVLETLFVPIAHEISHSLHTILKHGVSNIVVQGQFPMGCISVYLKVLNGTKTDKNGCIDAVMRISDRHNHYLKEVISNVSKEYKHANIVYFDTTAAYLHILQNAAKYNFTNVKEPCYVGGLEMLLASTVSTASFSPAQPQHKPIIKKEACKNPQNYISWDGIHLTDAMYGTMMKLFLTDSKFSSPFPNFLTKCTKTH
ncbi:hypothetical protein L7F22_056526 [Adiantum nelumboides]|nr:hypothetical protein [Adiantum nelumboides]